MDIPALQAALTEAKLDGWLLYDFHGQNPTAVNALGLEGHMLSRRWFYLVPRSGEPRVLTHAIEAGSFPAHVPGQRRTYASWQSQREELGAVLGTLRRGARVAMEYCPQGAIPYLSRVDAGMLELVRSFGVEVVSSGDLVQRFLCRWDEDQVASHRRALDAIDAAKDAAFARISEAHRRSEEPLETDLQRFLVRALRRGRPGDRSPAHRGGQRPRRRSALRALGPDPHAASAAATWCSSTCGRAGRGRATSSPTSPGSGTAAIARRPGSRRSSGSPSRRATRAWPSWSRLTASSRTLRGFEVDRAVRGHIASKGYGDRFVHRTGHSIGTRVHGDGANLDDLETHDTRPLVAGLGFSIEPGIYLPEEGLGVRSEIDVFLAADGPKVFGPVQQELVRI